MCLARYSTAASPGPCASARIADSAPSTCATSRGFWESLGKPCPQQRYPGPAGKDTRRDCLAVTKGACMRWLGYACQPHAGWRDPQGPVIRWACNRLQICRKAFICYKDLCNRVMKAGNIDSSGWEAAGSNRGRWRLATKENIRTGERKRGDQW